MPEQDNIHTQLKEVFADFEAEPSIDFWPAIEAELEKDRKRVAFWPYFVGIAASVIVLISFMWLMTEAVSPEEGTEIYANEKVDSLGGGEKGIAVLVDTLNKTVEDEPIAPLQEKETNTQVAESVKQSIPNRPKKPSDSQKPNEQEVQKDEYPIEPTVTHMAYEDEKGSEQKGTPKEVEINWANVGDDSLKRTPDPMIPEELPEPIVVQAPSTPTVMPVSHKRVIDFSNGTEILEFATESINKVIDTPINVMYEKDKEGESRTYQFSLRNFSITRKSHKKFLHKNQKSG